MGRYDRIAQLNSPTREGTFPGWLTLRDLEGREREPELGRRARLRFLALRPVRRLLAHGLQGPAADSIERQVHAVRDEVGRLPDRDPERALLTEYLEEIGGRTPGGIVRATLSVGAAAEADGQRYAAEEFYQTALELAEEHNLVGAQVSALRNLGRLYRDAAEWDEAERCLGAAAAVAHESGDGLAWGRSRDDTALLLRRRGRAGAARAVLAEVRDRGEAAGTVPLVALAEAGLCALELAEGDMEKAIAAGWRAVHLLAPEDEDRNRVLLNLASAFRHQGLPETAESAYRVVERWSAWPEVRAEAQLELAITAAERGDAAEFSAREAALLESVSLESVSPHDARTQALVALGLGRGYILLGNNDQARDQLRLGISTARDHDLHELLTQAEELLEALEAATEKHRTGAVAGSPPARSAAVDSTSLSADVRAVAERVVRLERELAPAGGH